MARVAIMTDTNSGFTQNEASEMGVFLLAMPFVIDGRDYKEGVNLSHEEFYAMMDRESSVATSQPALSDVWEMWDMITEQGYDEIVYIPMSSGLSNSCSTAIVLAKEYGSNVQIVDNHRISVTQKQSVMDALILANDGKSAAEIKQILEEEALDASIYIALDTLEHLKKGGRVTAAGAAIGGALNIKPVLTIQGDKLDAYAKVRGMKCARRRMIDAIKKELAGRFAELYAQKKLGLYMSYSYVPADVLESWYAQIQEAFPDMIIALDDPLALSIGCHIGPGALAIALCRIH